jgi:ABC-type multidrug transport system fused ATPase/permease subunit
MPPTAGDDNRTLLRFLGRRFVFASVLTFVAAILSGVVDYLFALVIQLFLHSMGLLANFAAPVSFPGMDRAIVVGGLLLALGVLRAAFIFIQGFGAGIANEVASSRIRTAAILRILPHDDGARVSTADAMFIYSEISSKASAYLLNLVKFLAASLQAIILGAAMLYLSWLDGVIAAGLLGIASVVLLRLNVRMGKVAKQMPVIWTDSVSALESAARNWFYIRIKHLHADERERLCRLNSDVQSIGFRLRAFFEIAPMGVNVLGVLMVAVLTNTRAVITHTSPPVFLSFLYVFLRFAQGLGDSARGASGLVEFKPYIERLRALVAGMPPRDAQDIARVDRDVTLWGRLRPLLPARRASPQSGAVERPPTLRSPRVRLQGVRFRYDEAKPWILDALDVDVASGSQLAIVGPSGCGKSTLLSLILGFLKPVGGSIDIDGTPPGQFCEQFAEYIGYVGPEPYIVTGTIRDNVLFGSNGSYSDEQIWRALSLAALTDVVERLPARLDTPLRHHDVQLSMGQRQRLALARALLPAPALLILDEASANLDDATEEAIAASIRTLKGTTTTIIVSHKLGLVRHADQVVDLSTVGKQSARLPANR